LAFWFFLIDQGPEKRDWFTSWEYKFWFLGPSLLFSALCCPSEPGSNGLSRLASAATILGMPFTTLVARNDIVTVNTFPLYFALPLDYSPDRCMDLPHRFLDLHGDQHSLHFHSRPLSCLPSPRYSRGRRSHRRRSPCHFLRAQCWFFPAFLIPCFWSIPTSMIACPDCVSIFCSNPAARPRNRWRSPFAPNQQQPVGHV
jgi:hypothetical protein